MLNLKNYISDFGSDLNPNPKLKLDFSIVKLKLKLINLI